jgi:hypothetical protein
MGFLNNQQDNFRKSNSPWGDDNITVYNIPQKRREGLNTEHIGYEEIEEMISELSSVKPSNREDAEIIDQKLNVLSKEKEKRNELEDVTRIERDDSFEPRNTIVKEDVVVKEIPTPTTNVDLDTSLDELDIELEQLLNDEMSIPSSISNKGNDTNDFLIAALIIIAVIKIID